MKWLEQAVYVAMKDVLHARWYILAYVMFVAIAAASASLAPRFAYASLWTLLVAGTGMLLMAIVIQEDSPSSAVTFWRSIPLDATAVLAGKLLFAVVVLLGVALIGQSIGLAFHNVGGLHFPRLLGLSAATYLWLLILAGLLAAITPDLRTFLLALVIVFVGMLLEGFVVAAAGVDRYYVGSRWASVVFAAAAVLLMAWQYRTRRTRAVIGGTVLLIVVPGAVPYALPAGSRAAGAAAEGAVPPELQSALTMPVTLSHQLRSARANLPRPVYLPLQVSEPWDGYRHLLRSARAVLHGAGGRSRDVATRVSPLLHAARPRLPDGTWVDDALLPGAGASFHADLTSEELAALERGDAWLVIDAVVEVQRAHEAAVVPLDSRATAVVRGGRLRIQSVDYGAGTVTVRTSMIQVQPVRRRFDGYMDETHTLALVNRHGTQTEGRLLNFRGGGTHGIGPVMFAPASTEELVYNAGPGTAPPDADWLSGAELIVTEWQPVGSYPVRLQVRVQD